MLEVQLIVRQLPNSGSLGCYIIAINLIAAIDGTEDDDILISTPEDDTIGIDFVGVNGHSPLH